MTNIMRRSGLNISAGLALAVIFSMPLFAEFTNGSFETGDFTAWTKASYLNSGGLVGNQPYSGASRSMSSGGSTAESVILTAAAEAGIDAQLTSAATLRYPKFGSYVARVNDTFSMMHANTILQRSTMTVNDVDPVDGKLHIRFTFAPVVETETHPATSSAYFYVAVRNVTHGNALLYETLRYANEPVYPWKVAGAASYTDWQLVDIVPGVSEISVGDVFSMEVTASGCVPTGHYAYAYVDSFNRDIPGLSVQAAADKVLVSTGGLITYTFAYRNGGAAAANNVVVKESIPAAALFSSVSNSTQCANAAGVVTCNFGTMAAGASGTFQVAVTVRSTATVSVTNNNYYIQASSYTPLLGPSVVVPIKGPPTNLSMYKRSSLSQPGLNELITYTLRVTNKGPNAANNVVIVDTLPAGVTFSSSTASQGACIGAFNITCNLGTIASLATSTVTITVRTTQAGDISNAASVSGSFDDTASVDNSSTAVVQCIVPPSEAPAGLTGTALGVSSITWTWSPVSNATSYKFYPSTGGAAIAVTGTSLTQVRLSTNTMYGARISAVNIKGEGPLSALATAYTLAVRPAGTQALVLSSAAIRVQWTTTGAAAYEVERSTLPGSDFVIAGSSAIVGAAALFNDQGLDPATVYYYRVRAYNGDGLATGYGSVVSTETYDAPPGPAGAPVLAVYVTSITFTWDPVSNAASYLFYPSSGGPAIPVSGTSLTLTGLSTNTFYGAQISAVNISGEGPASPSAEAYTLAVPPVGSQALVLSSETIRVQWTTTGASAYEVDRSTLPGSDFVIAGSSASVGAAALFNDQELNPATVYYYRVRAYNGDGVPTAYDAVVSTETYAAPPGPAGAPVLTVYITSVTFTWPPVSGAASYLFYPSSGGPAIPVYGTSLTLTDLSTNTFYGGQISAVNISGEGPLSDSGAAYTLAVPPAGTQALVLSSAAINVQWTSTGGTAYEVERSTLPGSGFVIAGSSAVVGAAALYADQGLDPATTYYYRVRAYNGDGVPSDYDAIASTETYAGPPGEPVMAAFTVSSDTFRWYWTPSGGQADSFTLYSATGTVIAVLPGTAGYYLETNVSSVTLSSRYLMASNHSGQAYSPIVTVATPYLQSFFTGTSTGPLVGIDGHTGLIVPASLMGDTTTWLISEDPLQGPLMSNTTSLIVTAGWPADLQGATVSLTEYLVAVNGNRYTGTLNPPVTVSVPYTDSNYPGYVDGTWPRVPVASLALYVLDETTGLWILVPGSAVDTVNKVVTATINHLSIFMAFGTGAVGDLSGVRVYPNPYRPGGSADQGGGDTGIVFDNLTKSVKIKIYTVTGRLVASFGTDSSSGALRWDVHNESGQPVTSGGYIAVITAPNVPKTIKKILVVR